jgi:hypothetical protein
MPPGLNRAAGPHGSLSNGAGDFATYYFTAQLPDPLALEHPEEQLTSAEFP